MKHFAVAVPQGASFSDFRLNLGRLFDMDELAEPAVLQSGFDKQVYSAFDRHKGRKLFVLGSVLDGTKVDTQVVVDRLASSDDLDTAVRELNGEFLIISVDALHSNLAVYSDRFASYPFYWASSSDQFVGSYLYTDLARFCRDWPGFKLRSEKAFEFFWLQRLMGTDTHDTISHFLAASTKLSLNASGKVSLKFYGDRKFEKHVGISERTLISRFVSLLGKAVKSRLPDQKSYGIFLSGGHDSRLVAAYADERAVCYTVGFSDNLEVECARSISQSLSQEHKFVRLDKDHFTKILEEAGYLSGGMYAVDHSLFVPVGSLGEIEEDVILHGHALDYMFQGMYLNASPVKLWGRNTFLKRFKTFPEDIALYFIESASFRLKYDFSRYFGSSRRETKELSKILYKTVRHLTDEAKAFGYSTEDTWEYLYFHQPSRHYTYTNVLSKRLHGEVRTPSFDLELYRFYRSLKSKDRLYAQMSRAAMRATKAKIGKIPAGNYGLPADWGPVRKTLGMILRKVLKEVTGDSGYAVPGGNERTWPNRRDYLSQNPEYLNHIRDAVDYCARCEVLSFIDWARVRKELPDLAESNGGASFLISALTYALFHKNVYR